MTERRSEDGNYKAWYDEAVAAANEAGYGPCTAADAIRGLAEEAAHYKKIAEEGTAPLIKSMKLENGEFDMSVTGPIVEAFAIALVGQFKAGGAVNYVEMSVFDRDEPFQRYAVTVQKAGAKSPADLVNEARAEVEALRAQIRYWKRGTDLINECLKKAAKADPLDAPMPLIGIEASRWHSYQAEAYRHALEMMGLPQDFGPIAKVAA